MKAVVAAVGLVAVLSAGAEAVTGVWTGAGADGKWTNAANWQDGVIPGRYQGASAVEGDWNGEAVFSSVADGAQTTVDLTGLKSIARITVRGADAPKFTFGTSASQKLPLEALTANDNWIKVESGVVNAPEFVAFVEFGWHERADDSRESVTAVRNDSSATLKFHQIGDSGWIDHDSGTGGTAVSRSLRWQGTGLIEVDGIWKYQNVYYSDSHKLVFENPTGVKFLQSLTLNGICEFRENARMEIAKDAVVTVNRANPSASYLDSRRLFGYSPFTIEGDGTLRLISRSVVHIDSACSDGTLACKVDYTTDTKSAATDAQTVYADGSLTLASGDNTFTAGLYLYGALDAGEIRLPSIGKIGSSSSVGGVTTLVSCNKGAFSFVGTAVDETDRTFEIGTVKWPSNLKRDTHQLTLNQNGSGALEVTSDLAISTTPTDKKHLLTLGGDGSADATWSGVLANKGAGYALSLTKAGSVRWILDGADTYTGATLVKGGTLALGANGSIAASSGVTLQNGATFEVVSGSKSIASLAVSGGSNTLKLGAGATLDVGALTADGTGRVKVELGAGATLCSSTIKDAAAPAWLTLNGSGVYFDADGKAGVQPATVEISARGGVIPNDQPDAIVGITSAGTSGDVTVADGADATVAALLQRTDTAANVALAGRTLTVGKLGIEQDGADLTLGGGTIAPKNGDLVLVNTRTDATLTVGGTLDLGTTGVLVKEGDGEAKLSGTTSTPFAADVQAGQLALDGGAQVTVGAKQVTVGSRLGESASLKIENATVGMLEDKAAYPDGLSIVVGSGGGVGALEIGAGAVVTAAVNVGAAAAGVYGQGALYLTDGSLVVPAVPGFSYIGFPVSPYIGGYVRIDGGDHKILNKVRLARQNYASFVVEQTGGKVAFSGGLDMGESSYTASHYYMTGGTNTTSVMCLPGLYWSAKGARSVLTLDGDCLYSVNNGESRSTVACGNPQNDPVDYGTETVFNLRGGVLKVGALTKCNAYAILPEATKCYVNFDGGTLHTVRKDCLFGAPTCRVDRVTTYAKGATIKVEKQFFATNHTEIAGPTGCGVENVVWKGTPAASRTYSGAPMVVIYDRAGKGHGATAFAKFDRATGKVTDVIMTSEGFDYEEPYAEIRCGVRGNATDGWLENACELTDANRVSGGLTKTGEGTLVMAAACTYTGDTVLKEGTLTMSGADATLASPVVLAGGRLEVKDGAAMPNLKFSATGDPVTYANDLPDLPCTILVDVTDAPWKSRTLATFTGAFSADKATVQVVGAENPGDWSARFVTMTDGAKVLRLSANRGVMIFVR